MNTMWESLVKIGPVHSEGTFKRLKKVMSTEHAVPGGQIKENN